MCAAAVQEEGLKYSIAFAAGLLAAGALGAFLLLPRSVAVGGYALRLLDGESSQSVAQREIEIGRAHV